MREWIVHVERTGIDRWSVMDRNPAGRNEEIIFYNSFNAYIKAGVDNNPDNMETYYFDDEASAVRFAKYISKKKVGQDVLIAKTTMIASTKPKDPTISKVTEKGIIPE